MTNDVDDQPGLSRKRWRSGDEGPEALARRTRALELAINYHVDTTIHNAEYLREVKHTEGVELRPTHYRHVVDTANAFDLFLMGQGPLVVEFAVRVSDKPPEPDEQPPTENEHGRQDPDPA